MQGYARKTDAAGTCELAGAGRGIVVRPGGAADVLPGAMPFTLVIEDQRGQFHRLPLSAPAAIKPAGGFKSVRMEGGSPDAGYDVALLADGDQIHAIGLKGSRTVNVQPAGTAVSQVAPAAETDGLALTAGIGALLLFPGGAAGTLTEYRMSEGGTWALTGGAYSTADGVIAVDVGVGAGRIAWVASAPAMTLEVDAQVDIG